MTKVKYLERKRNGKNIQFSLYVHYNYSLHGFRQCRRHSMGREKRYQVRYVLLPIREGESFLVKRKVYDACHVPLSLYPHRVT